MTENLNEDALFRSNKFAIEQAVKAAEAAVKKKETMKRTLESIYSSQGAAVVPMKFSSSVQMKFKNLNLKEHLIEIDLEDKKFRVATESFVDTVTEYFARLSTQITNLERTVQEQDRENRKLKNQMNAMLKESSHSADESIHREIRELRSIVSKLQKERRNDY